MKKACLVVAPAYQGNRIFDKTNEILNRDNCLAPFVYLKEEYLRKGYELSTNDINSEDTSDIVIFNEMPNSLPSGHDPSKSFLLLFETELIKRRNWNLANHKSFKKIFTWNDEFLDGEKYFKMNFSYEIPNRIPKKLDGKDKLCVLIAGNKMVKHPLELYSSRIEAIRWFETNFPDQFDLFGLGWDKYCFSGSFRHLNRFEFLREIYPAKRFPSYRGSIKSKAEILEKYKFSICYENAQNIDGYITEKIFDCFFAGCIPVYWGASNISDHIPDNCYIDKRRYGTYEELYEYLNSIDKVTYQSFLDSIELFLNSDSVDQFRASTFAETIVRESLCD